MFTYDLKRVRDAVQFLVESPYTAHHVRKLRAFVQKPRAMPFKDEAEVLNELLALGRQSSEALENLIELAEYKRDSRSDYQRNFMAAKRKRDRKVIEFETLVAGRPLTLDERNAALHKQYAVWNEEKAVFLAKRGNLSWGQRNEAIREFWMLKEAEFDSIVAEAHRASQRPHRKRVVQVKRESSTVLGEKLQAALNGRKKRPVRVDKQQ